MTINRERIYVPLPYDDELLYSVIARCSLHLGINSPKQLLELLFGSRSIVASTDLQGRLNRLKWLFEGRWNISVQEAALKYSLLPYYVLNNDPDERKQHVNALCADSGSALHTCLGICSSTVIIPDVLRFCEKCAIEDLHLHGETYWHRSHQLPGVLVCPDHGTALSKSSVPLRPQGRHEFVPLTEKLVRETLDLECIPGGKEDVCLEIAKMLVGFLKTNIEMPAVVNWAGAQQLIDDLGYARNSCGLKQLEEDFRNYYGDELLSQIDSSVTKDGLIPWLRGINRKPRRRLHPVRWVLIKHFCGRLTSKRQKRPFGDGPWLCHNRLSDHYKKPVVTDIRAFKDKRHPDRDLARLSCGCGYVYSLRGGQESLDIPYRIIEFGSLYRKEARLLFDRGYKIGAIARLLEVDWKTAQRLVKQGKSKLPVSVNPQDRNHWNQLIRNNPKLGVKALRAIEPALYKRLYRRDREWLRAHSPHVGKCESTPTRDVNWSERDRYYKQAVIQLVDNILLEDPPKRITKTLVGARLGALSLIEKKLHKLPETSKVLSERVEMREEFRYRRLQRVYEKQETSIAKTALLRKANIRAEYITPEIEDFLRKIYNDGTLVVGER